MKSNTWGPRLDDCLVEHIPALRAEIMHRRVVDESTGCWNWPNVKIGGYGSFWFGGRHHSAHRVAAVACMGFRPSSGLCVLHRCDNPRCVNPDHLFFGTLADNNHDRDGKDRFTALAGEANGWSKLVEADVRDIIRLRNIGLTLKEIAERFDLSITHVWRICRHDSWKHLHQLTAEGLEARRKLQSPEGGIK